MSHSEGEHLPQPSIWPATLAGGLTLVFFGLVSSVVFSIVGGIVTAVATIGWIAELRHE